MSTRTGPSAPPGPHALAAPRWSVVVAVKRLAEAKSRLADFAGAHREPLALAFACDTVAAALACDRVAAVYAVTDDPVAAARLAALGAAVTGDEPGGGLNAAYRRGAARARSERPALGVAALQADLPALRPAELARALDAAGAGTAFVADTPGTGTALYAAGPLAAFEPAFGGASAERHRGAGARELRITGVESVRRDVDTAEDLREAVALGVGPRTREVAGALGVAAAAATPCP
ncbi:2-phospho-L-lactate guanylyltransferase [Allonocardiopsis opalescens]|uniref:Phosphoenolpyruvate guanylyltransferase n=1 Tax=Allonocardiopsis opalescens TaxID=1144618 RepID=A0A2T0PVT9_9ACTN|nr:2-phospho-L-lactate guanylyltransferase [Allonocardiopsis opalescens]PRX95656.1 2-phospho-L-lactate guanylyltransferase [Allonocardiopsis opalescens]